MIDYLMKFDNESEARDDSVVGAYVVDGAWCGDRTIPGVQVRRLSDDVVLPFWYITISEKTDHPELRDHEACVLAVDWDRSEIVRIAPGLDPADYEVSPVYQGRDPIALLRTLANLRKDGK